MYTVGGGLNCNTTGGHGGLVGLCITFSHFLPPCLPLSAMALEMCEPKLVSTHGLS